MSQRTVTRNFWTTAPLGPRQLQPRSQSVPVSYDFDPNPFVHQSKRTLCIKEPERFPKNDSFHLSFRTKSWTCLDHPKTDRVPIQAPRSHSPRPPESSCSLKERLSFQKYQKSYQNRIFISDDTCRPMSATPSTPIFASILKKGRCPLRNQSAFQKTIVSTHHSQRSPGLPRITPKQIGYPSKPPRAPPQSSRIEL